MSYTVKLRGLLFTRTIRNVKGHLFPKDASGLLMLILENEERIFVNIKRFRTIWFSDGWFRHEAEAAERESCGQAKVPK
ncbi:unnamed protein product [marine sediment metagenome]|uniref:Uncharacterized protein n=1 Tax=marine sediment metagenome TaxID=412755 RepID=X0W7H2_9ZZZZ